MTAPIPIAVLQQHIAVLGKTRSGKSSVMRGLVEGLLERQQPVCIVDPKGDWWGIKLARDGKRPGYPVVIFGGEHADVPINARSGAHIAELFATGNRPCLIDLGGWMVGERTRFWIDFASNLFKHTRGMRWLAVDEIHNFAPKGKIMDPDSGKALHWTNRLASEGLGKGVHMIFASQRPQKVHNDTLTSAETLIAMRVLHPSDRGAVSDWIKGCGDLELGSKVLNSLAQMGRGEGWAWSPEIGFGPERVTFPMFKTYDSFRPQTAEDTSKLKGWAEVDLDDVKAKLADVVREADENDPKKLKARIRELERGGGIEERIAQVKIIERPVLKEGQLARLEALIEGLQKHGDKLLAEAAEFRNVIQPSFAALTGAEKKVWAPSRVARPEVRAQQHEMNHAARGALNELATGLPKGELACLRAAAQYREGVARDQMTILTGYKRSTRDAYIQRLAEKRMVSVFGNTIRATDLGSKTLGSDFEPLPTGVALRQYWIERLPEGERKILQVLILHHPAAVQRDDLTDTTGYKRSTRDAYLQRLGARRLAQFVGRGAVMASEVLFQ